MYPNRLKVKGPTFQPVEFHSGRADVSVWFRSVPFRAPAASTLCEVPGPKPRDDDDRTPVASVRPS